MPPKGASGRPTIPDIKRNWPPRLLIDPELRLLYIYNKEKQQYEFTFDCYTWRDAKAFIEEEKSPIFVYIGEKGNKGLREFIHQKKVDTKQVKPEDFRELTQAEFEGRETDPDPKIQALLDRNRSLGYINRSFNNGIVLNPALNPKKQEPTTTPEQVPMKQTTSVAEKPDETKHQLPLLLYNPFNGFVYEYNPDFDDYMYDTEYKTWEQVVALMNKYRSRLYRYTGGIRKFNDIIRGRIIDVKPEDFKEVTQVEYEGKPVEMDSDLKALAEQGPSSKPGRVPLKQPTNVVLQPLGTPTRVQNQPNPKTPVASKQKRPVLKAVKIQPALTKVDPALNKLFERAEMTFNDLIKTEEPTSGTRMRQLGRSYISYGQMRDVLIHKCSQTPEEAGVNLNTTEMSDEALDFYFELLKNKSRILGNARNLSNFSVFKDYVPMEFISPLAYSELRRNRKHNKDALEAKNRDPKYIFKPEFIYLDIKVDPRTVFLFPLLITGENMGSGGHWVLYAWALNTPRTLYYFDSLIALSGGREAIHAMFMKEIGRYLVTRADLVLAPADVVVQRDGWIPKSDYMQDLVVKTMFDDSHPERTPEHQQLGYKDCGFYVCWFAEQIIDDVKCLTEDFNENNDKYHPRNEMQAYQRYISISMMAGYCIGVNFAEMRRDTLGIATAAPPLPPPPPAIPSVEPSGAPPLPLAIPPVDDEGSSQPLSKEVRDDYKWLYGAPPVDDDSEEDDEGSSQPIPEDVRKEYYGYLDDDDIELPAPEGPAPVPVGSPPTLEEDEATAIKFPPELKEDKYLPSAPPLPQSEEDDIVYPLDDDDETPPPPTKPKHPKHPKHSKHSKHLPDDDEYDMNDGFIVDESPEEGQKALEELHEYMIQDSKAREARNKGEPLPPAPPPPPSPKAAAAAEAAAKAKKKGIVPTAEKKRIPPTLITDGKTVVQPAFAQVYGIKTPAGPPRTKQRERGPTLERRRAALDKMFPGSIEAAENLIERRKPDLTAAQPPKKKQKQPPPPPPPQPQPQSSEQEPVLDAAFFRSLM